VLFGHDSANCYLLSSSNDADISHYFSSGDAVISKKKVCETTISANSSDDTEKLHVEESEDSEGADEMSVLSSATDSDASFDSSEFEKFENDKDTDDDLIDIVSEKDETNKVETSKHATSGKDDDDLSFDVASEFADRSDDVAKMMADFHVDGKDKVDADSDATQKNVSDTKSKHKKHKEEKQVNPGGMNLDFLMDGAELVKQKIYKQTSSEIEFDKDNKHEEAPE